MTADAIVQARIGSTRLPGKVLMDLRGKPVLARVVERLARARTIGRIIIAIPKTAADDKLADLCERSGWLYFRGAEQDVLDRYYQAAKHFGSSWIVRVTSDCPLIDPSIVDEVVGEFCKHLPDVDYAANIVPPRTFPRGLDTEVMTFSALARAWKEATDPTHREHVTLYLLRHPEKFRLQAVRNRVDRSNLRWTLDTPEDYALIRRIYESFDHDHFSWEDVLNVLESNPSWLDINDHVKQKEY